MNEITNTSKRGISDFGLKYLAMVFMLLDHIEYFFSFTGKVPLFFSWIGRLAAPLFLFCIIEGFVHTHDRKKYFLHIYALAILMGLIQFSFYNIGSFLVRGDGFFPQNQMLASYVILIVVLQGIDWCEQKKWLPGITAIAVPILLPYIMAALFQLCGTNGNHTAGFLLNLLVFTVLPCHTFIADGGTATLFCGIILYLLRKHPKFQAFAFVLFCLLWDIVRGILCLHGNVSVSFFFTDAYEWMEIFAVIPMLCYNGTRGHGSKQLFYWFYPVHIYILYALSFMLYRLVV